MNDEGIHSYIWVIFSIFLNTMVQTIVSLSSMPQKHVISIPLGGSALGFGPIYKQEGTEYHSWICFEIHQPSFYLWFSEFFPLERRCYTAISVDGGEHIVGTLHPTHPLFPGVCVPVYMFVLGNDAEPVCVNLSTTQLKQK